MAKKLLSFALKFSMVLAIYPGFAMDHDKELPDQQKRYPACVATKIFRCLAAVLAQDESGSYVYEDLLSFNQLVAEILVKKDNPNSGCEVFRLEVMNAISLLERIQKERSLPQKALEIAEAVRLDLTKLLTKILPLETDDEIRCLIERDMPTIAAKEFLSYYADVEERDEHCDNCGHGYFKLHQSFKGKSSLECMLCNHHQNYP